jgi:hypothetical protein
MAHSNDLDALADNVSSYEDLASFLDEYATRIHSGEEPVQNSRTEVYLEALGRVLRDVEGMYANRGVDLALTPPLRVVANALLSAAIYD